MAVTREPQRASRACVRNTAQRARAEADSRPAQQEGRATPLSPAAPRACPRLPAWIAARIALAIALVSGAVAVARLVERHVRTSPAFATRSIEVTGLTTLTRDDVLHAAGLAVGRNVFEVAPEDAAARLRLH